MHGARCHGTIIVVYCCSSEIVDSAKGYAVGNAWTHMSDLRGERVSKSKHLRRRTPGTGISFIEVG